MNVKNVDELKRRNHAKTLGILIRNYSVVPHCGLYTKAFCSSSRTDTKTVEELFLKKIVKR